MSSNSTRELILPLCMLASVAAGVAIGGWLIWPATETKAITPRDVGDTQAVVTALDTLRIEVARLRESIERAPVTPPSPTRVEATSGDGTSATAASDELRTVSESLARTAELLQSAAARVGGDRAPLVPPRQIDARSFEKLFALEKGERTRSHSMWTYQQVMDKLGLPDRVRSAQDAGIVWYYVRPEGNVSFQFLDGRVVEVETHRKE